MLLQTAVVGTAALGMTLIIISVTLSRSPLCTVWRYHSKFSLWGGDWALDHPAEPDALYCDLGYVGCPTRSRERACRRADGLCAFDLAQRLAAKPRPKDALDDFPARSVVDDFVDGPGCPMLRYTRFGRHIFAIGSSEMTARLCGVSFEVPSC